MSDLPLAPLTGQPAIDYTTSRLGDDMPESGLCLQFVRQDFEIPSLYASAIDAWNACTTQHPDDRNPPPGVPAWFWSSSIYRHVAFHLGGGQYATTYNADIRQYGMASMESIYGPYMGWGEDVNARAVLVGGGAPSPEPPWEDPWEDYMRPWFIRRNDGAIVIVGPTGVRGITAVQWDVYGNLGLATFPPGMDNMDPGPFQEVINSLGGQVG